jgi:hypothetical protein
MSGYLDEITRNVSLQYATALFQLIVRPTNQLMQCRPKLFIKKQRFLIKMTPTIFSMVVAENVKKRINARETDRQSETQRHTHRRRQTERERQKGREREREREKREGEKGKGGREREKKGERGMA